MTPSRTAASQERVNLMGEVHAMVAGVAVSWEDLTSSRGWDVAEGYDLSDARDLLWFSSKSAAQAAARQICWPVDRAERGFTRFTRRRWALHCPGGGWLTVAGFERIKAATHRTETWTEASREEFSAWSVRTLRRCAPTARWVCSCGVGGPSDSRRDAAEAARLHRTAEANLTGRTASAG